MELSKEQLLEIIETDHVQCGGAAYMARRLLAAEEQQPVAWEVKGILCHTLDEARKYVGVPEPLYLHPQQGKAVQVPDENGLLPCPFCGGKAEEDSGRVAEYYGHEHQDIWITCTECGAEVWCDSDKDVPCSCHHDIRKVAYDKWNSRAAMLTSEPVSSGDGWIPVEDRLPENQKDKWSKDVIAISDTGDIFKLACMGGYWQRTQSFIDSGSTKITHWMPLPAAPKPE